MSKKESKKAADKKAVVAANKSGLGVFTKHKAKLEAALVALAEGKTAEGAAAMSASSASLELTRIAADYATDAYEVATAEASEAASHDLVMGDWRDNMRLVALELAAAGSPFAEASTNKAGDTVAKLTGTGNNVMSIAKGVVDFQLKVDDCVNDDGEVSYRSVRSTVEAKRKERRDADNPELALLAAAKDAAREAFKALAATVFDTGDVDLINKLAGSLTAMNTASAEAIAKQAEIDAKAAEAAAAAKAAEEKKVA